jgi:hypothetical protein
MPKPYAKVIEDTITEEGFRATTVESSLWRPILAEQNTHCSLDRNSASSRAIPAEKQLARFLNEFWYPAEFGAERPGMQQGPPLEGDDLAEALDLWDRLAAFIGGEIGAYLKRHPLKDAEGNPIDGAIRLHKGLINRWLEIGLGQIQVITATQWEGYFWQRCHAAADLNIRLMAEAIRDAREASTPRLLKPGDAHLPYFGSGGGFEDDWDNLAGRRDVQEGEMDLLTLAKRVSAGRCARVSNLNQDGRRDIVDDLRLYSRLADREHDLFEGDPPHASPLGHVLVPWADNVQYVTMPNGKTMGPLPRLGKMTGYLQMRHEELAF